METDNKGIVYLLTNECMPGIVKIDTTNCEDMDTRLRELYTTGVPLPFDCVYACKVDYFKKVKQALHEAFEPQRVNPDREFFRIKPSQAIAILKLFNKGNITAEVVKEMENDITEAYEKIKFKKRSAINFIEMGLHIGDTLAYVHDPMQTCIILSERKVEYCGKVTSLTAVTKKLLGTKWPVQPTPHWTYNNKNLYDIYNEWQAFITKENAEED